MLISTMPLIVPDYERSGKMQLYFAAGAQEVWLCNEDGDVEFFAVESAEPIKLSKLCPAFPVKVKMD